MNFRNILVAIRTANQLILFTQRMQFGTDDFINFNLVQMYMFMFFYCNYNNVYT